MLLWGCESDWMADDLGRTTLQDILERLAGEAATLRGFYQRRKVKAEPRNEALL
jgi:hypothetical protein